MARLAMPTIDVGTLVDSLMLVLQLLVDLSRLRLTFIIANWVIISESFELYLDFGKAIGVISFEMHSVAMTEVMKY